MRLPDVFANWPPVPLGGKLTTTGTGPLLLRQLAQSRSAGEEPPCGQAKSGLGPVSTWCRSGNLALRDHHRRRLNRLWTCHVGYRVAADDDRSSALLQGRSIDQRSAANAARHRQTCVLDEGCPTPLDRHAKRVDSSLGPRASFEGRSTRSDQRRRVSRSLRRHEVRRCRRHVFEVVCRDSAGCSRPSPRADLGRTGGGPRSCCSRRDGFASG